MENETQEGLFVIFGVNGDLSRRKLLPSLFKNHAAGKLSDKLLIVGVQRSEGSDESLRADALEALKQAGIAEGDTDSFLDRLRFFCMRSYESQNFQRLKDRLTEIQKKDSIPGNYAFYLSLPPSAFPTAIEGLGEVGLNTSDGWSRIVIEKPFGHDLESAQELNELLHSHFDESQIFRIDHYLGKDTVQNLLIFRFANALIESSWNRERIESVEILVGESLGVGSRADYYDTSGALRDMVQNHLTQLLTMVAMEVPESLTAEAIRHEKLKVLRSIDPIQPQDYVLGQYLGGEVDGETVPGYLEEQDIPKDSKTETFVALRLKVDTWRWAGVPFYQRTGKRLPEKKTQITVRFKEAPKRFFQELKCQKDSPDLLKIVLQPQEGFSFHFDIKVPGSPLCLANVPLAFEYDEFFEDELPDAYQTLLLDIIEGDQTLFVHADWAEESWRVYKPILEGERTICEYSVGSEGPAEAESFSVLPQTSR